MDETNQKKNAQLPFDLHQILGSKSTASTPPRYLAKVSPLDEITNNEPMHIIKAALPYLDFKTQKNMALLVKFLEFRNTLNIYQKKDSDLLQTMALHKEPKENMLQSIRSVCSEGNQNLIDIMLNLLNIKKLYKNYQQFQALQDKSSNNTKETDTPSEETFTTPKNPSSEETLSSFTSSNREDTSPQSENNTQSMIEQLKNMLTPEQKKMFDMFSTMMQNNQNNDQKGE